MHREIQIKQFPIVTTHWWPKTRNERFVWENEQYLYSFLPLVHNHVQVIWVRTRIRCVTCVCARALAHAASASTLYFSGVAWTGLGICMRRSDWLTPPLALEKLKSFQLLLRAAPVKRRDRPTIQFGNAWRHSIQSQREALTPTPRVNGALVCASAGSDLSHIYVTHCQSARTHRMRVRTQITWTWLCTRGKKWYKYCSFSHTNRSFRVLGHQCVVTMGNCLIWISLCMFFFPLIETVTYTCHYMTDRLERFDLKTSKLDLLKKKRHLHLGCPWGKLIDTKF